MIERIMAIAQKEFNQIRRDRRSLGLLLFVPTFTLLLFGFVLSLDTRHIAMAVIDEDRTEESRCFVWSFLRSEYFDLTTEAPDRSRAQRIIERGDVDAVLIVPPGFSRRLLAGESVDVQALINGGNPNVATAAAGYVGIFTRDYSTKLTTSYLQTRGSDVAVPVDYRPRIWFNPELKSSRYLVPGLMGYVMIITTVLSTALSIVREKERGTIEQIVVSPVTDGEFIIGKTIPYFLIACFLATAIVIAGRLLFDVPVRGSIPLLASALFFFIIGGLSMGLLISTAAKTQETAFALATFATVLPTQLLSGFIFPIENMPSILRWVTHLVPARYLLIVLRGILLKGAPLDAFLSSYLALILFAILTTGLAIRRVRLHGG